MTNTLNKSRNKDNPIKINAVVSLSQHLTFLMKVKLENILKKISHQNWTIRIKEWVIVVKRQVSNFSAIS
jgi:hypothetical protein